MMPPGEARRVVTATLVRHGGSDGLITMRDDVPLGTQYRVDPASVRDIRAVHLPTGIQHTVRAVQDVEARVCTSGGTECWPCRHEWCGGWLPVDVLELGPA